MDPGCLFNGLPQIEFPFKSKLLLCDMKRLKDSLQTGLGKSHNVVYLCSVT